MSAEIVSFPKRAGYAHLMICIAPDGSLTCQPDGDPEQIVRGLELLARAFREYPKSIRCAAGACQHDHHGKRPGR